MIPSARRASTGVQSQRRCAAGGGRELGAVSLMHCSKNVLIFAATWCTSPPLNRSARGTGTAAVALPCEGLACSCSLLTMHLIAACTARTLKLGAVQYRLGPRARRAWVIIFNQTSIFSENSRVGWIGLGC
jgi:hypothetical protein